MSKIVRKLSNSSRKFNLDAEKGDIDADLSVQIKSYAPSYYSGNDPPPKYREKDGEMSSSSGYSGSTTSSESGDGDEKKPEEIETIGYFKIFRYANSFDYLLLLVGTISSMIHGAALPLLFIVFGDMTNSFVEYGKYEPCDFDYIKCKEEGITNLTFPEWVNLFNTSQSPEELEAQMTTYSLYYTYMACGIIVFASLQSGCWMLQAARQTKKIRLLFFKSIVRQNIGFFDVNNAGELNTRISDDISKIQAGIGDKVSISIQMFCRTISGVIIAFCYGWQLALVIFAVSPLLIISAIIMFKITTSFTKKTLDNYAKAGAVAEEVLSSIRTVVAFGGQKKEVERYNVNLKYAKEVGVKRGLTQGVGTGMVMLIMFSTYGLAFWYGSKLVFDHVPGFDVGTMMTTFFSILIGAFSLGGAFSNVEYFSSAKAAAAQIFKIIDRVPDIDSASDEGHKPTHVKGDIEFKGVDFWYPSREDVQVLKKVNITAESGKTTALCGQSGCGKSTCIQLIQRFYDPKNGSVYLDGHDIRTLNVNWLRKNIGVVSQEPVLFDTTIAENIRYGGGDDITLEQIKEATKQSNAYDFIMRLPNKFDTVVGEGGAQMSGGQKQRIAIARAIVRNPKIMLLDEATSALDTESEAVVQAALEKASQGRTTIVIAHRLSTIRNSDKIIGFHEGEAVESGTHEELQNVPKGIYQNLCNMQSYGAEEGDGAAEEKKKDDRRQSKKSKRTSKRTRLISQRSTNSTSGKQDKEDGSDNEEEDEKEDEEDIPDVPFSRVVRLNKPELPWIIVGCCACAVTGGIQPAFAILFSNVISVFSLPEGPEQQNRVNIYAGLFVALGAIQFVTMVIQNYCLARSGEELTARLRSLGFKAMLRQNIAYFDDHFNSTGALTTRLATDAAKVQGITGTRLAVVIQAVFALGSGVGIAFAYGWQITLLTLAFTPMFALAGAAQMKAIQGQTDKEMKAFEKAGKISTETTINMRTVVSLTKEKDFYTKFEEACVDPYLASKRKSYYYGIAFGMSQSIIFFAYAALYRFGAYLVAEGLMQPEDVYKCLMAVIFGAMAVGQASSFAPDYAEAKLAANRLFKLFDRNPEIDIDDETGEEPDNSEGYINYTDIKFNYPTRPDVQVLKGLVAAIQPGQTVALVGQSGCGKSTCVQLLERFYDPVNEEGHVALDKRDVKGLNLRWLRSQMGIVSQEPTLFDCSIADNIRYGDNSRHASMDEVIACAKNANIHDFITSLPDGYDTNAGSKGTQLSGGQKQRVAIARALLRKPKVLLLDEATSALDTESEKVVQAALDDASKGRTCILIAHRLSTVKDADVIMVLENGVVVESGTHTELLALQGSYYSLVNAQLNRPSP